MTYASSELSLGTKAHDFALLDTITDRLFSLRDIGMGKKATVLFFTCNHCPYVHHIIDKVVEIAEKYKPQEVGFAAINANDASVSPQDGPEQMKAFANEHNFPFPYLYDQTQQVARTYKAASTPEFFVFDAEFKLVYHGQFDNSRPSSGEPVTGSDLTDALDAILQGHKPDATQQPAVGCSIKWKRPN